MATVNIILDTVTYYYTTGAIWGHYTFYYFYFFYKKHKIIIENLMTPNDPSCSIVLDKVLV
mgnify:CR=1 FL=1